MDKLKNKAVSLLRLDSGFFQVNILDYIEQKGMDYVSASTNAKGKTQKLRLGEATPMNQIIQK
ncbi:MAG: hypothetical protein ABI091_23265 [Ferruginibacter sp.]